jgi:hypothetical protein
MTTEPFLFGCKASARGVSRRRRAALALVPLLAVACAACGPTDRRGEATPSPPAALTPTATPTPVGTPTPEFRQTFVRVLGTPGTRFTGLLIDGSGSRSVDGEIPEDFVLDNPRGFISASFTKSDDGLQTITAQIVIDRVVVAEQSTTTDRGSITVNASLP